MSAEIISVQLVGYSPDLAVLPNQIVAHVMGKFPDLDGRPALIPTTGETPRDFPQFQIASTSNEYEVRVALNRTDVFWRRLRMPGDVDIASAVHKTIPFLVEIAGNLDSRVGRLACVANHFVRAENPGEVIANTYCAPDVIRSQFPSIREFEVHYLTRFDMGDGTEANNWIRVRSGEVTIRGESQGDAIILQNDINTAPESAEDGGL